MNPVQLSICKSPSTSINHSFLSLRVFVYEKLKWPIRIRFFFWLLLVLWHYGNTFGGYLWCYTKIILFEAPRWVTTRAIVCRNERSGVNGELAKGAMRVRLISSFDLYSCFLIWQVITGSTDGIGKEFAYQLAQRGFSVILVSRTLSKLKEVAADIGLFAKWNTSYRPMVIFMVFVDT